MHLALEKKHYRTVRALATLDPKLIRVQGRGGITPLHWVAGKKGDNKQELEDLLELLAEFLSTCRSSIEDLTSQCETAVHIAIKKCNTETFKVLFGWLKRTYMTEILDWKDHDGNNVLHIAVSENQPEIIKLLIGHTNINAKNFQDETALEILQAHPYGNQDVVKRLRRQKYLARLFTPTLSLSQFFTMELTFFEKHASFFGIQDKSTHKIILLVSTLIATATYQAALSPPGGYWVDSSSSLSANSTAVTAHPSGTANGKLHQAGNMILNGWKLYLFTVLNSTAFFTSIGTIWATGISLMSKPFMVYFSVTILSFAYIISLMVEFPKQNEVAAILLLAFFGCSLISVLLLPWCVHGMHIGALKRIDATRRRGDFLGSKDPK
ncbi:hypothetical protein EUGRSUZ_D00949 [Eucalyptus grandis]|uniref:Uncharacterized protein n=2 Tax=Eucalyptus grandis TaxID=71139 RepID=A0ACC3L4V2_EUCGR|nr:hypothetical protein EUGRSUZ_D00949 [Eucalyptus grandis]